ncbi:hypothetical protein BQ8420_14895 [Nocardiopsis sp. JB363]|nr:hypothetical protein BQ8420_14895 [Nocardiopsis sp. JB363]
MGELVGRCGHRWTTSRLSGGCRLDSRITLEPIGGSVDH